MKKIKTINKLLSSLTLLSPLSGIGFNNQYKNTQKVITENNNALNNYFSTNAEPVKMGDIWVTVDNSNPTIITGYSSGTGELVVLDYITEIAFSAFYHDGNITRLDLSNATSLTAVGNNAFDCSDKITEAILYLPNIESIGEKAFYHMNSQKNPNIKLTLGKNVNNIGEDAFRYSDIENVNLDSKNQYFSFATNLGPNAQVLISGTEGILKDTSNIVGGIISGDLIIPSSVTTIGQYAFYASSITSLDLSQATSLATIGDYAFQSCSNLTGDLVIPSSVTSIGAWALRSNTIDSLCFLSETPPTSFAESWQPTVTGKVYVPEGTKDTYVSEGYFGFDSSQVAEWTFDSSSTNINGDFSQINISTADIGSSSSEFSISGCSPETLSQNAFIWSLIPTGETQAIPNGLWISKGKINWKNVLEGTYTFKIQSSFDQWSKQSDQTITINVTGDTPVPPEPTPEKSSIPLILGLLIGLGIPVILAIAFVVWYLTRKKKTTVKI